MKFIEIFGRMFDRETRKPILVDTDGRIIPSINRKVVSVTKVLAAAGNYDAEDVLSESATVGTAYVFPGMAQYADGSGVILKAEAFCSTTALNPRLTLYLYNAVPSCALNDAAANTGLLAGDLPKRVGRIDFTAMEDLGGFSETLATSSTYGNLPLDFTCSDASGSLYGVLVTRDAITGEAAGMTMTIRLTAGRYT